MKRMQKVKNYVKDHKEEIMMTAWFSCITIAGCVLSWKVCKSKYYVPDGYITRDEPVKAFLGAIDRDYPEGTELHVGATNQMSMPISVDDLGKLGELFKESGAPENTTYTHILAVGLKK